jgi:murein DD-endopeptidase MepM/ murein hydrolase activator NlpD
MGEVTKYIYNWLIPVNIVNRPGTKITKVNAIVWHFTGNPKADYQVLYSTWIDSIKNKRAASSHYGIGLGGQIVRFIPEDEISFTSGVKIPDPAIAAAMRKGDPDPFPSNPNTTFHFYSISIEVCPFGTYAENCSYSSETMQAQIDLGAYLCSKYNLDPLVDMYRHYDMGIDNEDGTRRECPFYFVKNPDEWERFKRAVAAQVKKVSSKEIVFEDRGINDINPSLVTTNNNLLLEIDSTEQSRNSNKPGYGQLTFLVNAYREFLRSVNGGYPQRIENTPSVLNNRNNSNNTSISNDSSNSATNPAPNGSFVSPLNSPTCTSGYGKRFLTGYGENFHTGVDLVSNTDGARAPIKAFTDGKVIHSGNANDGYGNSITISHNVDGNIFYTFYGHMDSLHVNKGDRVSAGTRIGIMGNTGLSIGAHLHFEIRNASMTPIEPDDYLRKANIPSKPGLK